LANARPRTAPGAPGAPQHRARSHARRDVRLQGDHEPRQQKQKQPHARRTPGMTGFPRLGQAATTTNFKHARHTRKLAGGAGPSRLADMAHDSRRGLTLIGVMKLLKAVGLLALGIGVLSSLHRSAEETLRHWLEFLRVDSHGRLVDHLLEKVAGVSPRTLRRLGVGTLLYAAVFGTEGIGLLLAKPWAEYMTTLVTISFLPIEGYELIKRPSVVKALVLLINVVVVVYLVLEIRSRRARGGQPASASGGPSDAAASASKS
jgi:uncharacterized membrane protein (DUF2068 family)